MAEHPLVTPDDRAQKRAALRFLLFKLGRLGAVDDVAAGYAIVAGTLMTLAFTGTLKPEIVLVMAFLTGLMRPSDMGLRGAMTAGCYFWRPPNVLHGPMTTRNGQLIFFRTKGGTISVTYESVPGWERMLADYVAAEPFCPALAELTPDG